jgi:hypothetical protein
MAGLFEGVSFMESKIDKVAKFSLGQVVITPGAAAVIDSLEVQNALRRHQSADWGTVCSDDWNANDESLTEGARLLSSYVAANGVKFWIISEADRSATTVLLPEEY